VSHIGEQIITKKIVEAVSDYDASGLTETIKCQGKVFSCISLSQEYRHEQVWIPNDTSEYLCNDPYPKTVTEAINMLNNHNLDNASKAKTDHEDN
jgi:uncharacterized Zn-finger protein